MPDISMCPGGCPQEKTCYRFAARPDPFRQSYFQVAPFNRTTKTCRYYMPTNTVAPRQLRPRVNRAIEQRPPTHTTSTDRPIQSPATRSDDGREAD